MVAVIPLGEYAPVVEAIPAVGHGTVLKVGLGAAEFRVGVVGVGLRPPTPSSVEPNGTPTRPTAPEPIPDGDEADDAGLPRELPAVTGHVPDAVPAKPPPSNVVAAAEVPVPYAMPPIAPPMPDEVPAGELATP